MADETSTLRVMVFLTEDDLAGHRLLADAIVDQAAAAGLSAGTIWRGIEGFGASGHLRAARLPDLARGLPLVVELADREETLTSFLETVRELAPGALVTTEPVAASA